MSFILLFTVMRIFIRFCFLFLVGNLTDNLQAHSASFNYLLGFDASKDLEGTRKSEKNPQTAKILPDFQTKSRDPMPGTTSTCVAGFTSTNSCGTYTFTNTGSAQPAIQTFSFVGVNPPASFTTTAATNTVSFSAGTYTVTQTVSDSGCVDTQSLVIVVPPSPDPSFSFGNSMQCLDGNNFTFTASQITGAHSYSFSPGAGAPGSASTYSYGPVSFSLAGSYTITHEVNDLGCTDITSSVVVIHPEPTATLSQTHSTCGLNNGSLQISITSTAQIISGYTLNGTSIASPTATGLTAGNYSLEISNNFGCISNYTFGITTTPSITAMLSSGSNPTCGNANGTITTGSVTGGTPSYSFNLNGGAYGTITSFTSLNPGTYSIGVIDNIGCTYSTTVALTNIPGPSSATVIPTHPKCGNPNGSATVTSVAGGTPPFQYSFNGGTFSGSSSISGLSAGVHTVMVTDANNCTITANFTLTDPGNPASTIGALSHVNCFGNANGSIILNTSGGMPGYTYTLNPGAVVNTSGFFSGLSAQSYFIIVSDALGCTTTATAGITQPSPLALSFTTTPNTCAGAVGSVTIGVNGGTAAYSYSIDGSASANITTGLSNGTHTATLKDANGCSIAASFNMNLTPGPNTATIQTTNPTCGNSNGSASITSVSGGAAPYSYSFNGSAFAGATSVGGLSAGVHTVTIRDANTCTINVTFTLTDPGNPVPSINSLTNVSCFGGTNGSFMLNATGGFPGYSFTLSPSMVINTSGSFSGLTAQAYTIAVKDNIGCAATLSLSISQPPVLAMTLTPTQITCNGYNNGIIAMSANGGVQPYQYSLNGGAYTSVTNFNGLAPGAYSVSVRDANNCTLLQTLTITQPAPLAITFTTIPNSCTGTVGSVTIGVSGGTTAYTYSVDGTATSYSATNLSSGTHNALVRDANGCTISSTFSIGLITGPTGANVAVSNAPCGNNNSSATVTAVSGGTPAYMYSFNGGAFSSITSAGNLPAGGHNVIVRDANTCTVQVFFVVSNTSSQQFAITGITNVDCFGGSNGSFTATSNAGSYTVIPGGYVNTTGIFSGLTAGNYTVMIQHAAGCVATVTVAVPQPATPVTLTLSSSGSVNCFGGNNGNIVANSSGGISPYQYSINGGAFQSSASFTNLTAGVYNITVKDAYGCTLTKTVSITQPAPLNLSTSSSNAKCTAANGAAFVMVNGGTPAYTYSWSGGGGSAALTTSLAAGVYTVFVTDSKGCTQSANATINSTPGGSALITASNNITCFGMNNGSMTSGTTGSMTAPLTYSWSNGQTTQTAVNLSPGNYSVVVTDAHGCIGSAFGTISQPAILNFAVSTSSTSCFNGNNGSASANYISGGTLPLTYLWSPGSGTTSSISNLQQGVYSCTITDSKGCTGVQTGTITQPSSVTLTSTVTTANCGASNGSATVTASGGISPYNFTWSNATNGPVLSGVSAGNFSVSVVDANNCTYTTSVVLANAATPIIGISNQVNVSCNGGNNGAATATISNAAPPFSFQWSNGQTGSNASNLMAGVHTVTLTDKNGCAVSTTVNISQPSVLNLIASSVNANCTAANGTASVTASGGVPAYTYTWSGAGGNSAQTNGLVAGTYSVTVRDANGCTNVAIATINATPGGNAVITSSTNVSCFGYNNGSMSAGVSGAMTNPLTYTWSNGQNTQTAVNLAAGNYTVTVRDVYGCTSSISANISQPAALNFNVSISNVNCFGGANGTTTANYLGGGTPPLNYLWSAGGASSVIANLPQGVYTCTLTDINGCVAVRSGTVTQPSSLTLTSTVSIATCNQSNGSATITANGGTPVYSYSWSNGSSSSMINGVPGGTYSVSVSDANNCVSTVAVSLANAAAPSLAFGSQVNVSCNGGSNGAASTIVNGGAAPYSYLWSNGQTNSNATNLMAGVYTSTVTDANGCKASMGFTITQPPILNLVTSSYNSNCTAANGTASVSVSGGNPAYTYTWSGNGGNSAQTTGLVAGNYTVTVMDANGCVRTAATTINSTNGGTAIISASTNVTCFGYSNGSMTAGTIGPMTAPLSYTWSNGQSTQAASNLPNGNYTVTITDVYGCVSSVSGNISQPAALNFNIITTSVSCYGGANGVATANYLGGGTAPFNYLWSAGGASSVAANLPQGVYTCTLSDVNGCLSVQSGTITQPSSITLSSTVTTANCNQANGSATVTAIGGVPAYSYTWSTGTNGTVLSNALAGTYTISVKDANNCLYTTAATIPNISGPVIGLLSQINVSCNGGSNGVATATVNGGTFPYVYQWSNGQNTGTATNLIAGVHTATVTDQMGCKASLSVVITQPQTLVVNVSGTDPKCNNMMNGTANAGVVGGTPGFTYTWTPLGGNGANASGLGAGNYFVTVTDANGCMASSSVSLNSPAPMYASVSSTNVSCFNACNGQAVGSASNTSGVVTWYWTGGPIPLTTQSISNLCAGTYTLVATDQNNCTANSIVTISQPAPLTAPISGSGNVSCFGSTNGFASVSPSGGTPAYSYSWVPSGGSMATASNLAAGNYSVTVTDSKGCFVVTPVTITQPPALQAQVSGTNITCNGANNGIGNLSYNGGTAPYSVLWYPGLFNTSTVSNLTPGTHTVEVSDNLGCKTSVTLNITQPSPLIAAVTTTNSNCTQANGSSCVSASGGAGGFTYQWNANPSMTLSCINNMVAGVYSITVTDANNCQATALAAINDISGPNVAITTTSAVSCYGGNNGIAVTAISGGSGTLSILWSYQAQSTYSVNNLPAGTHFITVMDSASCITSATVQITEPTQLVSAVTSVSHVSCNGLNNGQATMLVNGGSPAYNYNWIPSAQTSSAAVSLAAGTHTCLVTDAHGCTTQNTVTIVQPSSLAISGFTLTNLSCNGNSTGQIATTITGGSPAYTLNWSPSQPQNAIITNLAAGSYSLTVTDTKSCAITAAYIITEPSALMASITMSPATCGMANGSASVTVTGGTQAYTYNWNTPTPQNSPLISGISANTWNCNITDANGCIITQSIAIADAPGPQITATSFTSPLCFGQMNGSMGLSFTQGTAPFNIIWNNPSASATPTVNGIGAGVYSATVTDSYGCADVAIVNVTQPNPLVLNISPTQTICFGQSTQVYAASGGGIQPYSYTWSPAAFSGPGPHSVTLTANAAYSVTASDANGCATSAQNSYVFVNPPLTASGTSMRQCEGKQVSFTPNFSSPGNGGPYTYQWSNGSTGPSLNLTASYQSTVNTYWVIIKDGCTSPNSVATFSLSVDPLPSLNFAADDAKGCQPLSVLFTATSSCANPIFSWNTDDGHYTGSAVNVTYNTPGVHSVSLSVTSPEGCTQAAFAPNYIEVYPNPFAEFIADPWTTTEISPGVQFTNLSQGAVYYTWDFNDINSPNNSSAETNPQHIFESSGEHTVSLIAITERGCKDTVLHIIDVKAEFAFYVPNAFTPNNDGNNDIFLPKGIGFEEGRFLMLIFDRWGQEIFKTEDINQGWDGSVKGNAIVAEQGVYAYKIMVGDKLGVDHKIVGHVTCLPKESKFSGK
jgi:gliding motility-associated-like protein